MLKPMCSLLALASLCLAADAPKKAESKDDRVKIDNDQVRVLKVVDVAHKKNALHQHKLNRVMIYLDSGDMRITTEDGKSETQHWKAGDVAWSPAGPRHISENVSDKDVRIVEVELKDRPQSQRAAFVVPKLDPLKLDPKNYKLVFENDQARVFRVHVAAHAKEPMHEHLANRVVVAMNDARVRVTTAAGKAVEDTMHPGDVSWGGGPAKHQGENLGDTPADLVVVELKN